MAPRTRHYRRRPPRGRSRLPELLACAIVAVALAAAITTALWQIAQHIKGG